MSIVPAILLLVMAMSSAVIAWLVVRQVARRVASPSIEGRARRTSLEAN